MELTIKFTDEETLTLLGIVHGAIDDADGIEDEIRVLVEIESKLREARHRRRVSNQDRSRDE